MSETRPLRFGLIGTSGHADRVAAPVVRRSACASLIGAVGTTKDGSQAFAARHRTPKQFTDVSHMLSDPEIDAVWICSPNYLHAEQVIQCALAGKHVLVEKPLATKDADMQAAAMAAEQAGIVLRVGFQHRFRPAHMKVRELLQSDLVGRIGYVRIHRFWSWPYFEGLDPAGPPDWRRSRATSGGWVINDIGSHLIDLMLWLSDRQGVFAGGMLASQKFDFETEDSTAILVRLGSNAIGVMEASNANQTEGSRIEVCGSDGWIRADDTLTGNGVVTAHDGQRHLFDTIGPLDAYDFELSDFATSVQGDLNYGADANAGRAVSRIIDDALRNGVRASYTTTE